MPQSWVTRPRPPGAVQEGGPLPLVPAGQEGKEHPAPPSVPPSPRSAVWPTASSPPASGTGACRPTTGPGLEHWTPGARAPRERAQEPLSSSGSFLFLENCVCSLPAGHCGCWVGRRGGVLPSQSPLSLPPRNQAPLCFKERAPQLPRNAVPLGRSSGPGGCPGRQVWDPHSAPNHREPR